MADPTRFFLFQLADSFGLWNVDELAEAMPVRLLFEWQAFRQQQPFSWQMADWRAGTVAATLANIHRQRGREAFRPGDFMAKWGAPARPKSGRDIYQAIKAGLGFCGLSGLTRKK